MVQLQSVKGGENIKMNDNILETENGTYVKLDERYTSTIELIERISKLVPYNKDKVAYLETLISYVDALINGDSIHQYTTYQYVSNYAKEALKEIMAETHARILESYRQERRQLTIDVEELKTRKSNLDSQVQSLNSQKDNLVSETSSLSIELDKIRRELEDLRNNGIARVKGEVSVKRRRLNDEVNSLIAQKNTLSTSIGELRETINTYNKTIDSLSKDDGEIEWVPIDKNSPVYSLNKYTIKEYIKSLILEYSKMANVPFDSANQTVRYNCQGLFSILTILEKHVFLYDSFNGANINTIINNNKWGYVNDSNAANSIREALKTIKLPVFRKKTTNIDSYSLSPDTIPTDINSILRELHLQRTTAEALAKQKILEKELEIVVNILKSVAPKEDLKGYLQTLDEIDKSINPTDTPKLQL